MAAEQALRVNRMMPEFNAAATRLRECPERACRDVDPELR
jgi:hypothetical protein